MSSDRRVAGPQRVGLGVSRITRAWRGLPPERRLAAGAALALFLTLFLPWYQETVIANGSKKLQAASATLTGWAAFSFVEAAVLVVAVAVLTLLFQRAEGRAFHLPGGDGWIITAAGFWACALVVWRIFDKQGTSSHGQFATTAGIEWGILAALAVAGLLAYAGARIRAAHQPEPPLPGERGFRGPDPEPRPSPAARRPLRSPRPVPAGDPPTRRMAEGSESDQPTRRMAEGSESDQPTRRLADSSQTTPGPARSNSAPRRPRQPDDQLRIPLDHED